MNQINEGEKLPEEWAEGAIVHIYKNKGSPEDCNAYRPICLTQLIYKVWSQLITRRLANITHIITSKNQYGYKEKLPTVDAILKIEEHIENATPDTSILLMDLTKAFDTVNRTLLWTALYRKGLPLKMIQNIRNGHQNTTLMAKDKNQYGGKIKNNIGVFQGSAISALLFIIYLDDVMDDYTSLNDDQLIQKRCTPERCDQAQRKIISQKIKNIYTTETKQQQEKLLRKLHKEIQKDPKNKTQEHYIEQLKNKY